MTLRNLAAAELQRRLETMSTEELLRMLGQHTRRRATSRSGEHRIERASEIPAPRRRSSAPPPMGPSRASEAPPSGTIMTVREAVLRAIRDARAPLTSGEIVAAAAELRPGTAEPTIRAEISRMNAAGELHLQGGSERRFRAA